MGVEKKKKGRKKGNWSKIEEKYLYYSPFNIGPMTTIKNSWSGRALLRERLQGRGVGVGVGRIFLESHKY